MRRIHLAAAIAALLVTGANSSPIFANSLNLMLPCAFSKNQGVPLAHTVNLDVAASTARLLPKQNRMDFWLSLPVERHVANWWLLKTLDRLEEKTADDPLRPFLGVPLSAVAAVSSTSFGGPHTRTTYRYRFTSHESTQLVAAHFTKRGLKQKQLSGKSVWWKGTDDELDFSFDRNDPFHFDIGKPQRFSLLGNELQLSPHFDELKAAQTCLSGQVQPTGPAAVLHELRETLAAFLKTEKANLLAGFVWDHNVYFGKENGLGQLLSEQLSKTDSVDMEELLRELRRETQAEETIPKLPLPLPIAPIFADVVTGDGIGGVENKIERWALMAVLFTDAQSATLAGPILIQRMKALYQTKFKMTPPKFDVVVKAVGKQDRYGLFFRAQRSLLQSTDQSNLNPITLWHQALVRGEFDVLSVE